MPGEINIYTCGCQAAPGTQAPDLAPYVVSIGGLQGIITLNGTGILDITTSGNTINFGLQPGAGLGTVTSVDISSSNSNVVVGGGPITTFGTLTVALAGALNSISGLVTAADLMIYTTASDTYATTSLTAFARTLLDDAAAVNARSTLGLVIGTNVQAWNQELDDFITAATFTGVNITFAGNVTGLAAGFTSGTFNADVQIDQNLNVDLAITCGTISGDGSGLTNLDAGDIATGTLAVARGGTGLASYTTGQVLYASAATTIAGLTAGAAGTFLRFAGAGVAPVVSTLILPNAGTTGDVFIATATNTMGRVTGVATGNVFLSGGVGVIPAWGKVTSTHTDGSTIATLSAGANSNITALQSPITYSDTQTYNSSVIILAELVDSVASAGSINDILTSTSTGVLWSNQITLDTITINTNIGIEGTLTPGGTTGAQTINKPCGTVRFAAAATSLVVTNSLCTTSHRVLACVCTNDTTAYVKNVVTTTGSFTIVLGVAATAETEVFWQLIQVT